ncbi:MAG: NADH-quinone oxidoreductase subunit J [Candidatus Dormibacteraeota bacterium]|nr:NADH-quinone oxidoreductase subunit J [Candidatus Dormibacteraeota bacterium]
MTVLLGAAMVLAAIAGLGVVLSRQTIYSALSLVATIVMISVIFLLLNAQFLFAVQIIIYAGAVMVLFVFIIALLSPDAEDRPALDVRSVIGLIAIVAITVVVFVTARNGITFSGNTFRGQAIGSASNPYHAFSYPVDAVNASGNVQNTAGQLFTTFLLPFEITSLLLLVAVIGAVYLTRRGAQSR